MSDLTNTPRSPRIQEGEQRAKLARLGARVVETLRDLDIKGIGEPGYEETAALTSGLCLGLKLYARNLGLLEKL